MKDSSINGTAPRLGVRWRSRATVVALLIALLSAAPVGAASDVGLAPDAAFNASVGTTLDSTAQAVAVDSWD